jgi:4-hydroxy-3-methylbut-2-enyl diphosphate reductase
LRELAQRLGAEAYLIDDASYIQPNWLTGKNSVGVTAGASAPEILVQEVVERLRALGDVTAVESEGQAENIVFSLPRALAVDVTEKSR